MSSARPWNGVPDFPGPRAARHAAILRMLWMCKDPIKIEALGRALSELYASAWQDPIPDEDREWVLSYRERIAKRWNGVVQDLSGKWAYKGYLKSSGGTFDEKLAPPYEMVEAGWSAFGQRAANAPTEEAELQTLEAAVAAYSECSGQPGPAGLEPLARRASRRPSGRDKAEGLTRRRGQLTRLRCELHRILRREIVEHLLNQGIAVTYTMCAQEWESVKRREKQNEFLNGQMPGVTGFECRYVWDFRYDPEKLSPKLTDPDAITVDDIIDAMIASPTPPPGWLFPDLVPMLCPLGAGDGWGCPDRPGDPGGGDEPESDR